MFDNKSECYKLFWFKALLNYVSAGKTDITFEELVDEMISEAWYMVTEYHLNLGPRDTLEKVVKHRHRLLKVIGLLFISAVLTNVLN